MLETLLQLDTNLLLFFNGQHSPFWDRFFWLFSSTVIWLPLYASLLFAIFKAHGWRGLWTLLAIALVITLCDQIASGLLKPLFERPRPSREPALEGLIHLVNSYRGGRFGFVSSHASNSFGLALFTSLLFRKPGYVFFIFMWALLNSYSRIYLGVHYPGDIVGGMLVGLLSAGLVYFLYKRFTNRLQTPLSNPGISYPSGTVVYTGLVSIAMLLLAARELF